MEDEAGGDANAREEGVGVLVITRGDAPTIPEPSEAVFDLVALFMEWHFWARGVAMKT